MSEPDEDVTVEERGVSVRKSINDHQFETLAVVFDIRAGRDEASTVTLFDTVPDDVPVDDIGFHPEYGGEHWHADEGEVVFSRTFEPGEQYTTVYGIRDFDGERAGLLAEPSVEVGAAEPGAPDAAGEVGDADGIDALVSEEDSEIVREVIAGERDTLPGLDEGAGAGAASAEASAGEDDELADVDLPGPGEGDAEAGEPAGVAPGDAGEEAAADEGAGADLGEGEEEAVDEDEAVDEEIASLGADEPVDADVEAADEEVEPTGEEAEAAPAEAAEDDVPEVDEEIAGLGADGPEDEAEAATGAGMTDDEAGPGEDEADEPTPADEAEPIDEEAGDEVAGPEDAPADPEAADDAETGVGAVVHDVGESEAPLEDEAAGRAEAGGDAPAADESDEAEAGEAAGDEEITVPVTGGIARVLAKELRAGNVSYEDRRLLREELLPDDGSTDARIKHLQNTVADLEAYTDALEQFLDEEGGAEAALERIEERVDSIASEVEAVERSIGSVDDRVASLRDDVADVEEEVDDVADDVDEVEDEVEAVSGDVERVTDDVERFEDDLASVRDDLDRIDEVGRRVGGVEDDVSAIQEELEELATFRDRLSSVFGPGGMGGGDQGEENGGE